MAGDVVPQPASFTLGAAAADPTYSARTGLQYVGAGAHTRSPKNPRSTVGVSVSWPSNTRAATVDGAGRADIASEWMRQRCLHLPQTIQKTSDSKVMIDLANEYTNAEWQLNCYTEDAATHVVHQLDLVYEHLAEL